MEQRFFHCIDTLHKQWRSSESNRRRMGLHWGGFVGFLDNITNLEVIFTDVLNTGNVTTESKSGSHDGGIIGAISKPQNGTVVFTNVTNMGNVSSRPTDTKSSASGLIGRIEDDEAYPVNLTMNNCANTGNIDDGTGRVSGLFYLGSDEIHSAQSFLSNCVNKGNISGWYRWYGIANSVTTAKNIVSLGYVGENTFWESAYETKGLYALDYDNRDYPDGTTLFSRDPATGYFKTKNGNKWVDELLNSQLRNENSEIRWTSNLDVSRKITVDFTHPISTAFESAAGNTLRRTAELNSIDLDSFVCADGNTNGVLEDTTVLWTDTNIQLGHWLTVRGVLDSHTIVLHETRLGDVDVLATFFGNSTFGVFSTNKTRCTPDTTVTEDMEVSVLPLSQIEITLEPDDGSTIDDKELSRVIEVIVRDCGGTVDSVDVIENEDGVLVVRITLTEDSVDDVLGALQECSRENHCFCAPL